MSNYTKTTNFTVKDNLTTDTPAKIIRGGEIDDEFVNLQPAVNRKSDTASTTLTGTVPAPTVTVTVTLPAGTIDGGRY